MGEVGLVGDMQSGAALGRFLSQLGAMGVDVETVVQDAAIDLAAVRESHDRVAVDVHARLWQALQRRAPSEGLGLALAESIEAGWFSVFDFVVRSSSTLGDAVLKAGRYAPLINEALSLQLEVEGELARLRVRPAAASRKLAHLNELAVAGPLVVARQLCGVHLVPTDVRMQHAQPRDLRAYDRVFGCPLLFGAPDNELRFPSALLHTPIAGSDRELQRVLEQHAQLLLERLPRATGWIVRVQRAIESELPDGNPHAAHVAQRLGMSERTLRRRLAEEGTSYQAALDQVRHRLASECLRGRRLSVTETAHRLGFSSVSAFNKARKRWARRA